MLIRVSSVQSSAKNPVATAPGSDTATLADLSTFCAKPFGKSAISNPKSEIRPLALRKSALCTDKAGFSIEENRESDYL